MEAIHTETVAVTDNGMRYEIDFSIVRNHERNIENGGMRLLTMTAAYRLRKDGSRGLRLKSFNKRLHEIATLAREPNALHSQIVELEKRRVYTCGHTARRDISRQIDGLLLQIAEGR